MGRFLTSALLLVAAASSTLAISCGNGQLCPQDSPCCSQYGECGVGAYCLGGCDPVNSFNLQSCAPMPVCKSANYNFNSISNIEANTKYLGDANAADWVSSGEPAEYDNSVLLTMAQGTVGTLLASSHYVWYGKVSATMKTSAGQGVVTAFILLSDTKDEIDFEFVGNDLQTAQTNYYSQGVTNYNNGGKSTVSSNTMSNWHTYTVDWQVDTLTWSIDGNVIRTLNKADTWNATAGRYTYPQTPARVQLSLWPAGLPTNPQGTIDWAGGDISWNSPYMTNGYYYAQYQSVSIQCYDPPAGANIQGSNSYIITDKAATNNTVEITNKDTRLGSFLATGNNPSYGNNTASSSTTGKATATQQTVPGMTGLGPGSDNHDDGSSSSSASGNAGTSATRSATGSVGTGGFQQGSSGASGPAGEAVVGGSLFAAIVAVVGLCLL